MAAVRTQFTRGELSARGPLAPLREAIEQAVPLSAGRYNTAVAPTAAPRIAALTALAEEAGFDPAHDAGNWALQLGTLGGGNHFIEVTVDELDRVWLFLHSGSRGIGNKIAMRHITVARAAMERWWITLPDPDLAYLVEDTDEFWTYIRELRWAQHFALLNREEMMDRVVAATGAFVGTAAEEQERANCLAGETLVTTRYGASPIEELAGATHELLTSDGVWVKAPIRSFGPQAVSEVRLSRSGVIKTIRATASHRWLLRTRRGHQREASTDELKAGDRLQFTFPRRLSELKPDLEARRARTSNTFDSCARRSVSARSEYVLESGSAWAAPRANCTSRD